MERMHGRTVQKDVNESDYYDGVVSHSEPDILESEIKWALGSTAVNKASWYDGIPAELFKILKDDAIKVLHSLCQQTWKTSSGHTTGKGQSSSQFPRRVVLKNAHSTEQLHLSPRLVGFPGSASGKEPAYQCRRRKSHGFNPWVGKIPWRRARQPTPSILAWRIPWTEEPGGLWSIGSQEVRHDWSDLAQHTQHIMS